ncbi:MAG TPA: ABC transporter permease [Pyrinomonadaceae bacterium]|nr:ABC transporter permease [Pyrinomonadaceae bacterium]
MTGFRQDVTYGARMLLKRPGFTAVAVLTLALGIGANSAIFSVVNAVLLRPLPYEEAERLVRIGGRDLRRAAEPPGTFSPPDFYDWRARSTNVFEGVAAIDGWSPSLTGTGEPERIQAAKVSANFFSLLRAAPAAGRTFLTEEERRGNHYVVVLSHGLWQRRFGGDPSIVGRQIELTGEKLTVVGIMPREFQMPRFTGYDYEEPELWIPFAPDLANWTRSGRSVDAGIARLKAGVTIEQAQGEMEQIGRGLQEQYPKSNATATVKVVSLYEQLVGATRPALLVFVAAVGFVLLIACANVANLLLARSAARQKEIAIRAALGASRVRVVRQLLTESVLLSLVGGALGLLLAMWANDLLLALSAGAIPRIEGAGLDARVLLFTFAVSALTGIVFGLAPALQASKTDLNEMLKDGGRTTYGTTRGRVRALLVVSEVALSLVLLVGAGLLIKSFARLSAVDPGFDTENVLTMTVFLNGKKYPRDEEHPVFFDAVVERARTLPDVEHVGLVSNLPVSGNFDRISIYPEGQLIAEGEAQDTEQYMVNADYFGALRIPLREGRIFTSEDRSEAPPAVVVSESTAHNFWPNESAVGKRIKTGDASNPWLNVVGVVGDVRHYGLDKPANMQIYRPHAQRPSQQMTLVVRTRTEPEAHAGRVREQLWAVDRDQPVYDIKTMREYVADSIAERRFSMLIVAVFALVALLLAVVGVYGVMSYTVAQRTHEIGVRMALGARGTDILKLVIGQGMILALAGVATGILAAFVVTRAMSSLLFGVSALDASIFTAVAVLLASVALLACYIPARRATRVDPLVALRYE